MLRNDDLVREKQLDNGISSFNYSNKCFYKKQWNEETIKARGLFIDTSTGNIVARSYNKFFNIEERPETKFNVLKSTFQYPIAAYYKYNGFLALVAADKDNPDKLFIASKSTNQGEYAGYIKTIIHNLLPEFDLRCFAHFLHEQNATAIFECINIEHDPHIIEYKYDDLIMLDIIYNDYDYHHMDYNSMRNVADTFGFKSKNVAATINNWSDFVDFIQCVEDYANMEGFVFEDAAGQMVKYKVPWYRNWKQARGVLQQVYNGRDINTIKNIKNKLSFCPKLLEYIPNYVKYLTDNKCPSIIQLRKDFYCDTVDD